MKDRPRLDARGLSHPGRVRTVNEDQFFVCQILRRLQVVDSSLPEGTVSSRDLNPRGHFLALADGVGGSARGEEASRLALGGFVEYVVEAMAVGRREGPLEDELLAELNSAVASAHHRLLHQVEGDPKLRGMATTLTLAYVFGQRVLVTHVGDSRCYIVREGVAERITQDQTYAQLLVDRGVMEPDEADASRWSHVLSSAVGGAEGDDPEVLSYKTMLEEGETLVLCTDGLTKHVSDAEIAEIAGSAPSLPEACQSLVTAALEGGGTDNVTVIVGRLEAPG